MLRQSFYAEEELGLFNPAYVGFLLYSSIREFVSFKAEGAHCALPFIILPMAMNEAIASTFPATYRTPIASWVSSNEGVLSELVEQCKSYNPIVRAAISFLMDRHLLCINSKGYFVLEKNNMVKSSTLFRKSNNMSNALKASLFLGRWFSHAPSTEIIFIQLGIRP